MEKPSEDKKTKFHNPSKSRFSVEHARLSAKRRNASAVPQMFAHVYVGNERMEFEGDLEQTMRVMGIKFGLFSFAEKSKLLRAFLSGLPEPTHSLTLRYPGKIRYISRLR